MNWKSTVQLTDLINMIRFRKAVSNWRLSVTAISAGACGREWALNLINETSCVLQENFQSFQSYATQCVEILRNPDIPA